MYHDRYFMQKKKLLQ